jgi:hypothetical protein
LVAGPLLGFSGGRREENTAKIANPANPANPANGGVGIPPKPRHNLHPVNAKLGAG